MMSSFPSYSGLSEFNVTVSPDDLLLWKGEEKPYAVLWYRPCGLHMYYSIIILTEKKMLFLWWWKVEESGGLRAILEGAS